MLMHTCAYFQSGEGLIAGTALQQPDPLVVVL